MKITNTLLPTTNFYDLPFNSWFLDNYGNLCYKNSRHGALIFDKDKRAIDFDDSFDADAKEHYVVAVVDVEIRIVPRKED